MFFKNKRISYNKKYSHIYVVENFYREFLLKKTKV